jgi:hypothetical protein
VTNDFCATITALNTTFSGIDFNKMLAVFYYHCLQNIEESTPSRIKYTFRHSGSGETSNHCSGGVGRTGQVLAAWLVAGRGLSSKSAIAAVKQAGKNPYEAVIAAPFQGRNPWKVAAEFNLLLDECDRLRSQ